MLLPCSCHALAMLADLPCSCHGLAMLLPCSCHALAMLLLCSCHALAMLLPCSCHALPVSRNGAGPAGQQRTAAGHEGWSATIASNNKRARAGQQRTAADSSGQQPSTEDAQQGVEKTGLWLCGAGRPALPRPGGPLRLVRGVRRWLAGFFGPLES